MNAKDIFLEAIDRSDPEDRCVFVANACGDDDQLRRRVDALLAAHDDPDSYLARPAAKFDITQSFEGDGKNSSLSDSSSHHGRFLPGTRVADRYRIVSLLGRGGMGEVYRADDLRLGQSVALKFLPEELAKDKKRLDYFHNEVKLARQISHPNVCRVYDIGEVDGQHFISMEYIDGEDLNVLLRRIGRLPHDKGVQIAHQLCSGINAAHSAGVLHRDLKPANVMIDGRGHVRLTDFGLASFSPDAENVIGMSGTPAYMAPEQLLRGETSIQSDLYSLGLILYELFTGRSAHQAESLQDLRKFHEESSGPRDPSSHVSDLDSAVNHAVLRCLKREPHERPSSANQLMAMLPGGDPLAAAMAAGETPSARLVAAAGGETISARRALGLYVTVLLGLAVIPFVSSGSFGIHQFKLKDPPVALASRARQVLEDLGYDHELEDEAFGFNTTDQQAAARDRSNNAIEHFLPIFWYRQHTSGLFANRTWDGISLTDSRVSWADPPWTESNMIGCKLKSTGELVSFRVVLHPSERSESKPDWEQWFPEDLTGISLAELEPVSHDVLPPVPCDHVAAWTFTKDGPRDEDSEPYVVAASYRGKPVFFQVRDFSRAPELTMQHGRALVGLLIAWLAFAGGAVLAIRHFVLERIDRRGSTRLMVAIFLLNMLIWLLSASHLADGREHNLISTGLMTALFRATLCTLVYVAIEPVVRRFWPQSLISWVRVLNGDWKNERVGRDVLVGMAGGLLVVSILRLVQRYSGNLSVCESASLVGGSYLAAHLLRNVNTAVEYSLFDLMMLVLVRVAVRFESIAGLIVTAIITFHMTYNVPDQNIMVPTMFVFFGTGVAILIRFGLLAFVAMIVTGRTVSFPFTTDTTAYYFESGVLSLALLAIIASVAIYGCWSRKVPREVDLSDSPHFSLRRT